MNADPILQETLIKRSQQKKRTSPLNYKERLFVLTKSRLTYYENRSEKKNKKGSIDLPTIKCAEIVKHDSSPIPCQNKYPFQVFMEVLESLQVLPQASTSCLFRDQEIVALSHPHCLTWGTCLPQTSM